MNTKRHTIFIIRYHKLICSIIMNHTHFMAHYFFSPLMFLCSSINLTKYLLGNYRLRHSLFPSQKYFFVHQYLWQRIISFFKSLSHPMFNINAIIWNVTNVHQYLFFYQQEWQIIDYGITSYDTTLISFHYYFFINQ